ncbi:hypothetical protein IWW52_004787, partial [Coemansia sp. RSA 2704]
MEPENEARALEQAEALYSEAVHETPPNRTKLDNLVDLLCDHPQLLYKTFFTKAHEAASIVVDVWHGTGDMNADDNLSILTPPAAWGWTVMEETICHPPPPEILETRYPQLAKQFLELAGRTLDHTDSTPGLIVRRAVQSLTRFWPEIINACISLKTTNPVWKELYEATLRLAGVLSLMTERSDDPALQMHLVKFLETEATIFTSLPKPVASQRGTLNLDMLPDKHAYIVKADLARRGELARQQLVRLLPSSDHMRLCNTSFITAIINSIVYLMNLRPQFCQELLERLTNWYAVINSSEQTMTHLQLVIISKTLRIALLHLYTRRYMGAYSEVLEHTLDTLGGPEWIRWQEQQTRERERRQRQRARERELAPRQQVPDEGPHTARWVPAPEEGQEELAYQPAPGADADFGVPPPPDMAGQKRSTRGDAADDDEDEEKQMQLLEESAKRVKLEEDKGAPALPALSPEEEQRRLERQQKALADDKDIEADMQATLLATKQFELPAMDVMTPDMRQEHVMVAIRRVVDGSQKLRDFIEHKRILQGATTTPAAAGEQHTQVLPNGLSTNSKVLEDSMVMLVRLVSHCYIMAFEDCRASGTAGNMGQSTQWNEMHKCVERILQTIIEAPRSQFGLAMVLLYELWMSVVITDPTLARMPNQPGNEYTVLALYLDWCERIFDAVVKCSMESASTLATVPAAGGANPDAAATEQNGAAVVPQQQPQSQLDELILNFIKEAPYLPSGYLSKLEECLKSPSTAALGCVTLERAIELRPPIFSAGLDILLTYSVHPHRDTRVGCIRAVKKHYPNGESASRIAKAATSYFSIAVERATKQCAEMEDSVAAVFAKVDEVPPNGEQASAEGIENRKAEALAVRKEAEQAIEAGLVVHMELLLALSTKDSSLLNQVFKLYRATPPSVQAAIRRIITPL